MLAATRASISTPVAAVVVTREAIRTPSVAERFVTSVGWTLVAGTPEEMDTTIKTELPLIRDMIANAGVKAQ